MTKNPISSSSPFVFIFFLFLLLSSFHVCTCLSLKTVVEKPETNGMFVFGSSIVDNGNNNFVENAASRVDYFPYGIDFPQGPTGRFSNGKNIIDALGQLLKLPDPIPAFLHPMTKGRKIVHGVNFASGSSGILDATGFRSGRTISLSQQIRNFEEVTLPNLCVQLDCESRKSLSDVLWNYLFVVGCGGNDIQLNYFLPSNTSRYNLEDFTANLTITYARHITRLYSLGARKFILISVYPIGCLPYVKAIFNITQGCFEPLNEAVLLFNTDLKVLADVLKLEMPGSNFVVVNYYQIMMDVIKDPFSKGFNNPNSACCEVTISSEGGDGVLCKRSGLVCEDRNAHVFFDGLHTSEAADTLIAHKAYDSNNPAEAYPFNIKQLTSLKADEVKPINFDNIL